MYNNIYYWGDNFFIKNLLIKEGLSEKKNKKEKYLYLESMLFCKKTLEKCLKMN